MVRPIFVQVIVSYNVITKACLAWYSIQECNCNFMLVAYGFISRLIYFHKGEMKIEVNEIRYCDPLP